MRAVVLREFGGPEVLRDEEVPTPTLGPGTLFVAVTRQTGEQWGAREYILGCIEASLSRLRTDRSWQRLTHSRPSLWREFSSDKE
jgi:hypothetical protein